MFEGWLGEKKTAFIIWLFLNRKIYRRFHNIILPSKNGTTQIDHLIVSPYGFFIVETKNKKGWIFGSEHQAEWTQILFNSKYEFQNPLRQTYRQKKVLAEFLDIPESLIHTIVYFVGDCRFKTPIPGNVLQSGLPRYIKSFRNPVLSDEDLERLLRTLEAFLSISELRHKDHLASLKQRHSSLATCPKCGAKLVERTARKGPTAGSRFLACSSYPNCRFTRSI